MLDYQLHLEFTDPWRLRGYPYLITDDCPFLTTGIAFTDLPVSLQAMGLPPPGLLRAAGVGGGTCKCRVWSLALSPSRDV